MYIVILYINGYLLDSIEDGFYGPFESERDAEEFAKKKIRDRDCESYRIIELSK